MTDLISWIASFYRWSNEIIISSGNDTLNNFTDQPCVENEFENETNKIYWTRFQSLAMFVSLQGNSIGSLQRNWYALVVQSIERWTSSGQAQFTHIVRRMDNRRKTFLLILTSNEVFAEEVGDYTNFPRLIIFLECYSTCLDWTITRLTFIVSTVLPKQILHEAIQFHVCIFAIQTIGNNHTYYNVPIELNDRFNSFQRCSSMFIGLINFNSGNCRNKSTLYPW